ncbi:MAG TPA: hypothetical protein VFQ65_07025 [Kofleriaceae bacterium]|nr:hypothetical protein [Kofleriaceae bacterium]
MRGANLGLALAVALACRAPAPAELFNAAPAGAGRTPERSLQQQLAAFAVTDADFYRPVLYTWTSPAQIAELRRSHVLLTATAATGGFVSPFLRALAITATHAGSSRDVARVLLTDPRLVRRRYAWPAPFATVLGVGSRTYGTTLIRIELRSDAWIGRYEPAAADPFRFVDASGATVELAQVVSHPERIGAIFHVRTELAIPFREYVICNPVMIASWSVATPAIRTELAAELATIGAVARAPRATIASWLDSWHAALAFDTERYEPTPTALATLAAALDAYDPTGEPLEIEYP